MADVRLGLYEKATPKELTWRERLEAAGRAGYDFLEISIDETGWTGRPGTWTSSLPPCGRPGCPSARCA